VDPTKVKRIDRQAAAVKGRKIRKGTSAGGDEGDGQGGLMEKIDGMVSHG